MFLSVNSNTHGATVRTRSLSAGRVRERFLTVPDPRAAANVGEPPGASTLGTCVRPGVAEPDCEPVEG